MKRFISLMYLLILTGACVLGQNSPVKVVFVGASITYGVGVDNIKQNSFPAQLQRLLGSKYQVDNFGVSGCTMLHKGNLPYWKTEQYQKALADNPNIVFVDLGGNDSKWINRTHMGEFENDCRQMVQSFSQLPTHPRVILMLPVVSFVQDTTGIWDPVIVKQIIPRIQQVAFDLGVEVIDMHSLMVNQPALLPDKIHPNTLGAAISAHRLYELLVQKNDHKYDIFSKIKEPLKVTSYYGYSCASFTFQGRSCKVVKPKWSAPGRPWIWRARFWGHEPQTEIALLERGFHVVYCDVAELFGNDEAIAAWNGFYTMLNKAGLSKKNVLEGMSRGAVYALNWAAENPNKVSAVYIDNPLLDMKSWPCGLGKVSASPQELAAFKKDYNITTDEQLRAFKNSPVDKVSQIVRGGYPILILCADADEAAVPDDNTIPFEEKMRNLNGKLTIMHKPGFKHYPHSFPNPAPIVDFILKSTGYAVGLN